MTVLVWILGDQLIENHPAILRAEMLAPCDAIHIVLVESASRKKRLPYHRKKLVLLVSAMRHYAEALRARGYVVDTVRAESTLDGLHRRAREVKFERVITMAAAEYRGRRLQEDRLAQLLGVPVEVLPNTHFLVERGEPIIFRDRTVMEYFYRALRRRHDLLMDGNEPCGGRWNFDKKNRKSLPRAGVAAPPRARFEPDMITLEVMQEVGATDYGTGDVEGFDLAVTREGALEAMNDFCRTRLPLFGDYEDAMSAANPLLFHSLISPYLNLGLLDPLEVAQSAEVEYRAGRAPLHAVEGFVRQIVGWREYMYWQYWQQMPDMLDANAWHHRRRLLAFFWDGQTDLACLHTVIGRVLESGYSHHIERLMVLCNFAMLTGVDPAEVNDWFLSCYVDAYEWVVTPNVIGMGLNADGGRTATKPYVASANYINRMSDYCADCRYDPKQRMGEAACPFNFLYWDFLRRNEEELRKNQRFGPAVHGLKRVSMADQESMRRQATEFLATLREGERY